MRELPFLHPRCQVRGSHALPFREIKSFGVLCHVDLFPILEPGGDELEDGQEATSQAGTGTFQSPAFPGAAGPAPGPSRPSSNPYHPGYLPPSSPGSYAMPPLLPSSLAHHFQSIPAPLPVPDPLSYPLPTTTTSSLLPPFSMQATAPLPPLPPDMAVNLPGATPDHILMAARMNQQPMHGGDPFPNEQSPLDPDIIAYIGDFPIRESSKRTTDLVGATFVQSSGLEYQGRKALMFVFSVCIFEHIT